MISTRNADYHGSHAKARSAIKLACFQFKVAVLRKECLQVPNNLLDPYTAAY